MFKIVLISQNDEKTYHFLKAEKESEAAVREKIGFSYFDAWEADADDKIMKRLERETADADFVFLLLHGGTTWFRGFTKIESRIFSRKQFFYHSEIEEETRQIMEKSNLLAEEIRMISEYYELGGTENFKNLIIYLLAEFAGEDIPVKEAAIACREGIWGVSGQEEEALIRKAEESRKPVIGILVHYLNALNQDTDHILELAKAIERSGGFPFPVVCTMQPLERDGGLPGVIRHYFRKADGTARIHGLIITTGFSMTMLAEPGKGRQDCGESIFSDLGVPVFQAMTTYFTFEKWKNSRQGMDSMTLCSNIYEPELDGQIITTVIGCTQTQDTEYGRINRIVPVQEGISRTAELAVNWGRLRIRDADKKRVAILLHNMPPRRDMLGCAYGLDTPESVLGMVRVLEKEGLVLDRRWDSGQEIIRELTAGLTNESGYLTKEQIRERSAAVLSKEQYIKWYQSIPKKVRSKLERVWDKPPGSFMTLDGDILIPGISL